MLRDALRFLRRSPGISALASIALGIGSTTTMYSITRGILRELPVDRPDRLMHIAVTDRTAGDDYLRVPVPDLVALLEQQRSFEAVGAFEDMSVHVGDANRPAERVAGAVMTSGTFTVLRTAPLLGRPFNADDERPGATPVAVVGYRLWQTRYGGDRRLVGSTVRIDGRPTTIVGIMPDGFGFPRKEQLWTPLALDPTRVRAADIPAYVVIARLRDGVLTEGAAADVAAIGRRLALAAPSTHDGRALVARSFRDEMIPPSARIIFRAMLLVVSFVLLIACANVANLLLARAVTRSREIAVRLALGAAPGRLVRQLLLESLAVAIPGGVLGLALAYAGVTVFNATAGFELEFWMRVELDAPVLFFTTALIMIAAIAAGIAPARQASRVAVGDVLKDESRGSSSFRLGRASRALVVGEVALSCALLVITVLMVKGVIGATARYEGIALDHVAAGRIELRDDRYPDAASRMRLFSLLESQLLEQPGVTSVAVASHLPGNSAASSPVEIGGARYADPNFRPRTRVIAISPAFFTTFHAAMLQGRAFSAGDRIGAPPVAIVNRSFADRFLDGNAVGKEIRVRENGEWATVVGVAPVIGITGGNGDRASSDDAVYLPLAQSDHHNVALAARTTGDGLALVSTMRDLIGRLDPDIPLYQEGRLDVLLAKAGASERLFGGLFTFFGISALVLAMVGLVGMLSFSVSRRTRELGIRIALGARASSVLWLVLRGGLIQLGIGLTLGLAVAAAVAPQFGEALFDEHPHDPAVYALIGVVLIVTGAVAAIVPGRRALTVSPMTALRSE
jgi:putative ABC transport system permease protein